MLGFGMENRSESTTAANTVCDSRNVMDDLTESTFRGAFATILSSYRSALSKSLSDSLSTPTESGKPYLVEIYPDFFNLHCISE